MERKRLRAIIEVSFVKSEMTNFEEAFQSKKYRDLILQMDRSDILCFISKQHNQLVFLRGFTKVSTVGASWIVLFSQRMRIRRGPGFSDEFEPTMLANYARDCGIELIGIKLFENHLKRLTV